MSPNKDDHHDDHDDDDDDHHHERRDTHDHMDEDHHDEMNCTSCEAAYNLTRRVILSLGLTTSDCLEGHNHNTNPPQPSTSEGKYKKNCNFFVYCLVL